MSSPTQQLAPAGWWQIHAPALALALVGVILLVAGLLRARFEISLLGLPLILTFAWGLLARPARTISAGLRPASGHTQAGEVAALITLGAGEGVEVARIRISSPGFQGREALVRIHEKAGSAVIGNSGPGSAPDSAPDSAQGMAAAAESQPGDRGEEVANSRTLTARVATARTGVQDLWSLQAIGLGLDTAWVSPARAPAPLRVAVYPPLVALQGSPLPVTPSGLVGNHISRRFGDAFEFRDIHEFAAGDRIQRIDWKVSARRSIDARSRRLTQLYSRRTYADADAAVVCVVDSRDDVGPDATTWGGGRAGVRDEATSLDLAREAATAVARAVLDAGDRVGLDDLGLRRRPVVPAGGKRQFERIASRLSTLAPESFPSERRRSPQVPSGALIVLFSTFLDHEAARMARGWRMLGHRVIAVDTLPNVHTVGFQPEQRLAYELVMTERNTRLIDLAQHGVEILTWRDREARLAAWRALARVRPHQLRHVGVR